MKLSRYIFLLPLLALCGCSDDAPEQRPDDGGIYITVNLDSPQSRVAYAFENGDGISSSGSIKASWKLGDLIKVYEIERPGVTHPGYSATNPDPGPYSDTYLDYADYASQHPYPSAPQTDTYYRFVCVGGEGTTQGVFKYVGLATATVSEDPVNNIRNVDVDIKYAHAIHNWDTFEGLVIYGNPLRNSMMRTQAAKDDLTHLRLGQRMCGYICAHNFQWWFDEHSQATDGVGADRLVLQNVESCIFRVIIGGVDTDIYGGSVLSLSMPGITDQASVCAERNEPMTLTLGNPEDYELGLAPWTTADNPENPDPDKAFCAYIVGWPGTLAAGTPATVTLTEKMSGNTYTWELTSTDNIVFEEDYYYTIDLRDHQYTKSI